WWCLWWCLRERRIVRVVGQQDERLRHKAEENKDGEEERSEGWLGGGGAAPRGCGATDKLRENGRVDLGREGKREGGMMER
ncbi:hypothetical protein PGIGA_G00116100, partial [Pangasianodon gigas]|nr:hypothetical protein [Pangasianodon gigas]